MVAVCGGPILIQSTVPEMRDGHIWLRPLQEDEVDIVASWLSDIDLAMYVFGMDREMTPKYVSTAVEHYINMMRMIIEKCVSIRYDDKIIGMIFFTMRDVQGERLALVGILIGITEYRHHGYGTRALELLLEYLFSSMRCDMVELDTAEYNMPAQRSYQKIGFERCDTQRIYEGLPLPEDGSAAPAIFYRLTRERWRELHP